MPSLILNADDYGLRPHINEAIIETHREGILTSTTVMTTHITQEAVGEALKYPNLGLGLHLNLTSGEPLSENWKLKYGSFTRPLLYQPGQFDREVLFEYYSQFKSEDVLIEYEAQFARFTDLFKQNPTHIDSHFYSAFSPTTFPAYLELAVKHKLKARCATQFAPHLRQHYMLGDFEAMDEYTQQLHDAGVITPIRYSTLHPYRYPDYQERLLAELAELPQHAVLEVAVHPGKIQDWRPEDVAKATDKRAVNSRLLDREALLDKSFATNLERANIKLINYSSLN